MDFRGEEREKNLDLSEYYSDSYFSLQQLCSFAHQINDIYKLQPQSILEVGIGNGFTSTFLKRAGFRVTTADINPNLEPDICAPIESLKKHLYGKKFDLIVCCEVLEHIPFDNFEKTLSFFSELSPRLYLTLPSYRKVIGFSGWCRLPKLGFKNKSWLLELPTSRALDKEHFWEVGYSRETSLTEINKKLKHFYSSVVSARYQFNPYHRSFTCSAHPKIQ